FTDKRIHRFSDAVEGVCIHVGMVSRNPSKLERTRRGNKVLLGSAGAVNDGRNLVLAHFP
ncbi:hypothetical protein, partial [Rhodococcus sp. ARC_M6]|uniref:hypothetical protein n=1 Tax=Rhodococcus sp. ARC_M6 TaxID=2928852 RepID=UPI001FB5476C